MTNQKSNKNWTVDGVLKSLKGSGNARNRDGMARFGIAVKNAYGVPVPVIRKLAKEIGKNHGLALAFWKTGNHEARLLASMIDEVEKVTAAQMDYWARDFDSWDVCDQACMNLFDKTSFAFVKALEWSKRKREYEKRAGFALMACLAWHDKTSDDKKFLPFLRAVLRESDDERNFVKKAVNWALRQVGKRNRRLNQLAIHAAELLMKADLRSARWIGSDAFREMTSASTRSRLRGR